VCVGERDLGRAEQRQQQRKADVAAWEPRGERDEEDQHLEAVDCEAHVSMRVERIDPCAEDVGADQVDLKEDAERDRQRKREVQPGSAAPQRSDPADAARGREGLGR
jgi:hypothetical protein